MYVEINIKVTFWGLFFRIQRVFGLQFQFPVVETNRYVLQRIATLFFECLKVGKPLSQLQMTHTAA
jgi:hypothetical protein